MTKPGVELVVTSYPDSPELVAELWCSAGMFGAVRPTADLTRFVLLYPLPAPAPTTLDLAEVETVVAVAKRRILEIEGRTNLSDTTSG